MKKFLMIFGGIVVGIIILFLVIFLFVSATSKKLVCKSEKGNITIMYNEKTITGYTASNLTYDMDAQKAVAKDMGMEAYINEFANWFTTYTTGSCTK